MSPPDLDGAIWALNAARRAHSEWKGRFTRALDGSRCDDCDPVIIARDDACPLGRWLVHEAPPALREMPEHARALQQHAVFHSAAAEVASLLRQQDLVRARRAMAPRTKFDDASLGLVKLLRDWVTHLSALRRA